MIFISPIKIVSIFILLTAVISGQSIITGTITDSLSGDRLVGANVFIIGTSIGSATNIDGEYKIVNVPFGSRVF
jgi:hypothetical protein